MTKKSPYHNYIFLRLGDGRENTPSDALREYKKEFLKEFLLAVQSLKKVRIVSYSTLGLKKDIAVMLWLNGASLFDIQRALEKLVRTKLWKFFRIEYTLFGIARQSVYSSKHIRPMKEETERAPYLIVYPFTKTHEWYQLPFAERKSMMGEHIKCGLRHKGITQLLLYSTGVDDHEFVVSYETASLEKFQDLVTDLRSTSGRIYTKNDTPIFLCVHKPLPELLDGLLFSL